MSAQTRSVQQLSAQTQVVRGAFSRVAAGKPLRKAQTVLLLELAIEALEMQTALHAAVRRLSLNIAAHLAPAGRELPQTRTPAQRVRRP